MVVIGLAGRMQQHTLLQLLKTFDLDWRRLTEELEAGRRGSAARREAIIRRGKLESFRQQGRAAKKHRHHRQNLRDTWRCDLTPGKECDRAVMVRRTGVAVEKFVERGTCGKRRDAE